MLTTPGKVFAKNLDARVRKVMEPSDGRASRV